MGSNAIPAILEGIYKRIVFLKSFLCHFSKEWITLLLLLLVYPVHIKFLMIYILLPDNKRLDEWVEEDRLDLRKIQYPRRDLASAATTGLNTPKKTLTGTTNSRPSSPGLPPVRTTVYTLHACILLLLILLLFMYS